MQYWALASIRTKLDSCNSSESNPPTSQYNVLELYKMKGNIGDLVVSCPFFQARKWEGETEKFYCINRQTNAPILSKPEPPTLLLNRLKNKVTESVYCSEHIRSYNNILAMASTGCN